MAVLCAESQARIVGLQSREYLNGLIADVVRWVPEKDRWEVRLDAMEAADPSLALKPENLLPLGASEPKAVPPPGGTFRPGFLNNPEPRVSDRSDEGAPPTVGQRGALVFLGANAESAECVRARFASESSHTFEPRLREAGIDTCVFLTPMSAERTWYDRHSSYETPEDLAGIACSMEQVDGQIDKFVKSGISLRRIGVVGISDGGCLALHVAYGAGRYAGQLGAVACVSGFLPEDSILDIAAAERFRGRGKMPSPPLYMSHCADDPLVKADWVDCSHQRLAAAGIATPDGVVSFPSAQGLSFLDVQLLAQFFVQHIGTKS